MGVHTTCSITREDAIQEIIRKLFNASDDELSSMMFALYGDETLQNYRIVYGYEPNNESRQFRRFEDDQY